MNNRELIYLASLAAAVAACLAWWPPGVSWAVLVVTIAYTVAVEAGRDD